MSEISQVVKALELSDIIFKDVKFYVSGTINDKALDLLKSGGAERMIYFSDYVTHLICGRDCEENDLCDATDIYEIPALVEKWIYVSAQIKRLANTKPFIYNPNKLFTNKTFTFSRVSKDRINLWAIITYHGGDVQLNLNNKVTHLVTTQTESEKYRKALRYIDRIIIVTPDWVVESVRNKSLVSTVLFHPKLIMQPKVVKRLDTTSITGFEPEINEREEDNDSAGSTQALLDKLKQRMPWMQPADPPPNVVAPSFTGQKTIQEQHIFSPTSQPSQLISSANQVPRSVVHHTPQNQTFAQTNFQANTPNFNRILEQLQQRPNLHGVSRAGQQFLQKSNQQVVAVAGNVVQRQIIKQPTPSGPVTTQIVNRQLVNNQQQILTQSQKMQQLLQNQRILVTQQGQQGILLQKQALLQNQSIQSQMGINLDQQQNQHTNTIIAQNQVIQQHVPQNQTSQNDTLSQLINQQRIIQSQSGNQHNQTNLNQQLQQVQSQLSQQVQNQLQVQSHQMQLSQQLQQTQGSNQQVPQSSNQQVQQMQNQQQLQVQSQQLQNQQQLQVQNQQLQNQQQLQVQNQQQLQVQNQQQLQVQNQQQLQVQNQQQLQVQNQQQLQVQNQQQLQVQNQQQLQAQNQQQLQIQNQQLQQVHNQLQNQQIQQSQNTNEQIQNQVGNQQQQVQNLQLQQVQNQLQHQQLQVQNSQIPNQQIQVQNQQLQHQLRAQQNLLTQQKSQSIIQQQHQNPNTSNILNQQQQQRLGNPQHIVVSNQQLLSQHNVLSQQQSTAVSQTLNSQTLIKQQQQNLLNQQSQHVISPNQAVQTFTSMGKIVQAQFGQVTQQSSSQSQFVNNQVNTNFQQNQHFIQNQNYNQQSSPQIVQSGQVQTTPFVQQDQTAQTANLQIINQQQIIGQQIQKQGHNILVNGQQNQVQFQQQPGQPQQPRPIWQQQIVRHPNAVNFMQQGATRVHMAGGGNTPQPAVQRQFIQLDAQTHQQLQQMAPEERALFVQKLQKHRLLLQRQQQQQRILIRSTTPVPPGLSTQQHMQWLQQQAKQGLTIQQQTIPQPAQAQQSSVQTVQQPVQPQQTHTPGLSPIQQQPVTPQPFSDQNVQLQRQRLHQMQMQREQAQKNAQNLQQQTLVHVRPAVPEATCTPAPLDTNQSIQQNQLVNAKTKTALANMLSIRLQSGGSALGPGSDTIRLSDTISEPSAAGTLRLMTAQHNAALNSNNRAQEILALQQRRVVAAPTSDIVRPSGAIQVPQSPQGDPPKLQYSPRSVLPIQHRPGTFYGHNPNLKLPPDLFLLGCIFVVVELERFLDESIPGWQKKIEKHGGEIEKQYCTRVTHVLCETQRHGVVMQAMRDFKRCVTLYWLSDVMHRKQVLPPWTALHLPTMYLDTVPASKHLISLTGFAGTERDRVKHMIKYIGATLTTYFSKHNTLLIATKAEGAKYMHAKKWGLPVVNIQWLTDIMLGNFPALTQTEHIKYQQFSNPVNFCFDPVLVPNLMNAWKMPINISQESYERVKRSASPGAMPPKAKKLKTEHITDENENLEKIPLSNTHRILFSRCTELKEFKEIIIKLGGSVSKSANEATHLVLPELVRTTKLLHAVCVGLKILPESWVKASKLANTFLNENNYTFDTKEFNSKYKCDFEQTMLIRNRNKLLEGKFFFITPSVFPSKKALAEIVLACGGIVERTRRTLSQIEATNMNSPYSYIILTHEQDLHLVADLLKNKKDKIRIVCNVELILMAVLKQTFEVEPYVVKVV